MLTDRPILLLVPPNVGHVMPRGALEVASFARAHGWHAEVFPLAHSVPPSPDGDGWPGDEAVRSVLVDLVEELRPWLVGVSNQFTLHYPSSLRVLELCREIDPSIHTVIGGSHVTFLPEEAACEAAVDVVVRGEGEATLVELAAALWNGHDLSKVDGIAFEGPAGGVVVTPSRPLLDLACLPPIDLDVLPRGFIATMDAYAMMNRGCAFKCTFCSEQLFWKKRRDYPVGRVVAEVADIQAAGGRVVGIEDSMVYIGSPQFRSFCDLVVERNLDLKGDFFVLSRLDTIRPSGLDAMMRAGIRNVRVGIESGSPAVREVMNKGLTDEKIQSGLHLLGNHGIDTLTYWIIGHPGDTSERSRESLTLMGRLFSDELTRYAVISMFLPYPGTVYFSHPRNHGVRILSLDWRRWDRWSYDPVCELDEMPAKAIVAEFRSAVEILTSYRQNERQCAYEAEFSYRLQALQRQQRDHSDHGLLLGR